MPETRAGKLELADGEYFDHDPTLDKIRQDDDGAVQGEKDKKEEENVKQYTIVSNNL